MKNKCIGFSVAVLIMTGALAACDSKTPKAEVFGTAAASGAAGEVRQKADDAGQVLDDSAITAKAKWALAGMSDLKSVSISVETVRGRVTLSGHVDSEAESRRAATLVSRLEGVKAVENRLAVKIRV